VRGFWTNQQNAFFDTRIFYPFASSYLFATPSQLYKRVARAKKREYEERINFIEDGSFTPLVMSSSGGMCEEMSIAIKHLARLQAEKRNENYSKVISLLRCRLSFAMSRSALVCLRGSRSIIPRVFNDFSQDSLEIPTTVITSEARVR